MSNSQTAHGVSLRHGARATTVALLTISVLAGCTVTSSSAGSGIGLGGLVGSWTCHDPGAPGSMSTGTLAADGSGSVTTSKVTVRFQVRRSSAGFVINGVGYATESAGEVKIDAPIPALGKATGTSYAVNDKSQIAKLTAIITKDTLKVTRITKDVTYREDCTRNN